MDNSFNIEITKDVYDRLVMSLSSVRKYAREGAFYDPETVSGMNAAYEAILNIIRKCKEVDNNNAK